MQVAIKENKPLISVVTVVYNACQDIEKTIQSVLAQTDVNIEYIVVDGKSTDGTIEIIRRYKAKISKFISEQDAGIYDAMNKSENLISGDWLLFLNAGDLFFRENILSMLKNHLKSDVDILYGDVWVNKSGKLKMRRASWINKIWKGLPFSHQSSIVRSELFRRIKFDTTYEIAADYKFFNECISQKANFKQIDYPVSIISAGGKSDQERIGALNQILAIAKEYNIGLKCEIYIKYRKIIEILKLIIAG